MGSQASGSTAAPHETQGGERGAKEKGPKPSVLEKFLAAKAVESSQSAFQQGKKKESRLSRFRLYKEEPGDLFTPQSRDTLLMEQGMSDEKLHTMNEAQRKEASLELIHDNRAIADWQLFAIGATVRTNDSAKVTLPALGSRALAQDGKQPAKGRYGSRLVYLPGKDEENFTKVPGYLDVTNKI